MQPSVLIVEDDTALSELLQWHFNSEGYDVRATADGEDALMLVREQLPDLVVLDWMIESLSGVEVCRQLRKAKDSAKVPIMMLTARGEEEDKIRGLKTGADDYVTKPCWLGPRRCCAAAVRRWPAKCWSSTIWSSILRLTGSSAAAMCCTLVRPSSACCATSWKSRAGSTAARN
jgi:CheY-like chemotaxis protein